MRLFRMGVALDRRRFRMTAEHTIGPWRLNAGTETVIMGGSQYAIARAECGGMTGIKLPEAEANARLIAASPELLELAYQYVSDLRHPPTEDSRQRRIERAKQVIAKALGS